jgi:hypothetical protein
VALYGALSVTNATQQVPIPAGSSVLLARPTGGAGTLYVGTDNAVTTATGVPVLAGQSIGLSGRPAGGGPGTGVWLISDQVAGVDVRWLLGTY